MGVNWLYRRLEALFSPDFVQTSIISYLVVRLVGQYAPRVPMSSFILTFIRWKDQENRLAFRNGAVTS